MFVTIITDCRDNNAINRLSTRAAWLFGTPATFVGVSDFHTPENEELQAGLNLVDALDASQGSQGVVMVNVAHRHGKGKKWPNGTPFAYFKYKDTLITSTLDGYALSVAKKLGLIDELFVTDIPTVLEAMIQENVFPAEHKERVMKTQFRSYEYQPRLTHWLFEGRNVPSEKVDLQEIPDLEPFVLSTDNFGNCVTSLLPEEVGHESGKIIETTVGPIQCYERMKDVPNGETGFIVGSNGIDHSRFLSITIQGQSAAKTHNLIAGSRILPE